MFKVGEVNHYYDKLGIAIVELDGNLAVGDNVKFMKKGETFFEQTVKSIQVGHEKRTAALSGDVVGLKTNEAVEEGTEIFKI